MRQQTLGQDRRLGSSIPRFLSVSLPTMLNQQANSTIGKLNDSAWTSLTCLKVLDTRRTIFHREHALRTDTVSCLRFTAGSKGLT